MTEPRHGGSALRRASATTALALPLALGGCFGASTPEESDLVEEQPAVVQEEPVDEPFEEPLEDEGAGLQDPLPPEPLQDESEFGDDPAIDSEVEDDTVG